MLAARTADLMRGLFVCFAIGAILNIALIPSNSESFVRTVGGYGGYFAGKNSLGEFSTLAVLLAFHEMLYSGRRRALGIVIFIVAGLLIILSNSKTSFGLAFICPLLAAVILIIRKRTKISPAICLLSIPFCYAILSHVSAFNMNRVSYMMYGDSTFSGRTTIWEFAFHEIARRPLLGWGYQSFWLVGPDAPSVTEAPGWVAIMPNSHNGYYDTMLELGYVGYGLLVIFIIATLHAIGRVADCDFRKAWCVLALALYIIMYNWFESFWMRAFEVLWVVFVVLAVEICRYWQPSSPTGPAYGLRPPGPSNAGGPSRCARMPGREAHRRSLA
jgi:O-antigen ligase